MAFKKLMSEKKKTQTEQNHADADILFYFIYFNKAVYFDDWKDFSSANFSGS